MLSSLARAESERERGNTAATSSQIPEHAAMLAPKITSNQRAKLEPLTWKIFFSPLFFTYSLGKNSFKLEVYKEMSFIYLFSINVNYYYYVEKRNWTV